MLLVYSLINYETNKMIEPKEGELVPNLCLSVSFPRIKCELAKRREEAMTLPPTMRPPTADPSFPTVDGGTPDVLEDPREWLEEVCSQIPAYQRGRRCHLWPAPSVTAPLANAATFVATR